jgi:hypothetical protein
MSLTQPVKEYFELNLLFVCFVNAISVAVFLTNTLACQLVTLTKDLLALFMVLFCPAVWWQYVCVCVHILTHIFTRNLRPEFS